MNYEAGIKKGQKTKSHYVVSKDIDNNTVVVVEGDDNKALYKKRVGLADVNFINPIIRNSKFVNRNSSLSPCPHNW